MSDVAITVVDAFTAVPFTGNPAAVMVLDDTRDAAWMQAVAAEMNLSETAFVCRQGSEWQLRWFTPAVEVALCGHATLATAHALWERGDVPIGKAIRFQTRSGLLHARPGDGLIWLDFPALPATKIDAPDGLTSALGAPPASVGITAQDDPSERNLIVEVADVAVLAALSPDMTALAKMPVSGVIVTAIGGSVGADFSSRYFAPAAGIPEDPVTGSSHCTLGPWWVERVGKTRMVGRQLSQRGGTVHVVVGDDRVELGGQAVTVWRGELVGRR